MGSIPLFSRPQRARSNQVVRPRRPADLPACIRLMGMVSAEAHYPYRRPTSARAWLAGAEIWDAWVTEHDGELLGHVALTRIAPGGSAVHWREITGHQPGELAAISRLFVRAKARGRGLGSALLDTAVDDARRRGLLPVLEVVSNCHDAIRLYDDRGWRLRSIDVWPVDKSLKLLCYEAPPAA